MKKTFVMLLIIASTPLLSFAQERTEIVVQEKNTGWSGYVTNRCLLYTSDAADE